MRLFRIVFVGCAALAVAGAFAQALNCTKTVPNLICNGPQTPGSIGEFYRPEVINLDDVTIRDILLCNQVGTERLIVQVIEVTKVTPYLKCTAFVSGPGSGLNTNFDSGLRKATNADLDKDIINLAFGIPQGQVGLGNRALLFSPPGTTYTLSVTYVVLDGNGRPGKPITVSVVVTVQVPTREEIGCNVLYFSTVAAGATQKPKIDFPVDLVLLDILETVPDDLEALLDIETIVADSSVDFLTLLQLGDVRFYHNYMIDDDEEPIGCLLIEMANSALWH